jgi:Cu(I)/Ag(I) efflux system protein CusF
METFVRRTMSILASVAAVAITPMPAFAHHNTSHSIAVQSTREHAAPCAAHEGAGVVTAISGSEITLRHEPIASLNWPAMTMTFQAQSPGLLEGLAVGDHVRFRFQESGSAHVIDQIVKQ